MLKCAQRHKERFEVLVVVKKLVMVFWLVLCRLVGRYQNCGKIIIMLSPSSAQKMEAVCFV
jgi:hypothetical protein